MFKKLGVALLICLSLGSVAFAGTGGKGGVVFGSTTIDESKSSR
jgi:hypothetical protein